MRRGVGTDAFSGIKKQVLQNLDDGALAIGTRHRDNAGICEIGVKAFEDFCYPLQAQRHRRRVECFQPLQPVRKRGHSWE